MEALKSAQAEVNSTVAERRVPEALAQNILHAVDQKYETREKVLVDSKIKNMYWPI